MMMKFLVRSVVVAAAGWAAKRLASRLMAGRQPATIRPTSEPMSDQWRREMRRHS
jgi:hypothetical protein